MASDLDSSAHRGGRSTERACRLDHRDALSAPDSPPASSARASRSRLKSPPMSPVDSGRLGAPRRWGPVRVLRLDQLSNQQRAVVLALIEAAKPQPDGSTS